MENKDIEEFTPDRQLKEMHECLLNILIAIDKVCREHGLTYYLIAGTMLGAVRHKGFVPWDDDADVALPRKDYDILVEHANEWLPEQFELVSGRHDPMYPYNFARIQDKNTYYVLRRAFNFVGGVPVDIFPLDGMTENAVKRKIHYMKYGIMNRLLYYSLVDPYKHGHGAHMVFTKLMHKIIPQRWMHAKIDSLQQEYSGDGYTLTADHDNKPDRGILPTEVYGTPRPVEFCGHQFMGVSDPDAYLSFCYGDYMKPPKELPKQNFRELDLHSPFKEHENSEEHENTPGHSAKD